MKIWIIGKQGMLSQAVQRKCLEKGIDFIASTREELDLENKEAVIAQFETLRFTHVINCAGYTAVDRAEDEKEKAHALNAKAVALLAKLSKKKGNKFIHFSTDYVFNGAKKAYGEEDEKIPLSEYGKSKEMGERFLMKHYPDALLVRTSWLFGKEGKDFVKKMIELMDEKETISVVSDQRGRPTYADDLAESVLSILDESGIYHFANEGETTWYAFAETIRKKLKEKKDLRCQEVKPISSEAFGAKAKRPAFSVLRTEKFSPPHWEVGLEEVLNYALESK
ncbi:MAG: dTDP-4-dehydrorhamnose reductase [Simkaniaceae bacterium]|nr:dTDP-4-dehydrorhamnose reductase [Simkaniaceae bacterium]